MALPEHLDLRGSQRCRRRQLLLQNTSVETFHQFGGRCIVNFPHARYDSMSEKGSHVNDLVSYHRRAGYLCSRLWREYGTGLRQRGSFITRAGRNDLSNLSSATRFGHGEPAALQIGL